MKSKYFYQYSFLIVLLQFSCSIIVEPKCYVAFVNKSEHTLEYADLWLVEKSDTTQKFKIIQFEKLKSGDTSMVYKLDFSTSPSGIGTIAVNAKLQGISKNFYTQGWGFRGNKYYFDLPVPGANLLVYTITDEINLNKNNLSAELGKYKKSNILPYH